MGESPHECQRMGIDYMSVQVCLRVLGYLQSQCSSSLIIDTLWLGMFRCGTVDLCMCGSHSHASDSSIFRMLQYKINALYTDQQCMCINYLTSSHCVQTWMYVESILNHRNRVSIQTGCSTIAVLPFTQGWEGDGNGATERDTCHSAPTRTTGTIAEFTLEWLSQVGYLRAFYCHCIVWISSANGQCQVGVGLTWISGHDIINICYSIWPCKGRLGYI